MTRQRKRVGIAAVTVVLVGWIALGGSASAMDAGAQIGFGAGLAVGKTHSELATNGNQVKSGGSGLGFDAAARVWAGPVLLGGTATLLPALFGTTETLLMGGAGLKLNLGERWRLTSLAEAGAHTFLGLGNDLLADGSGGAVSLPCWGARLALEKRALRASTPAAGVALFFLADRGSRDLDVKVRGLISDRQERHRIGGTLVGVMARALFGS